ncbi:SEC10/PgrA surface exclusion domain-containing protein, partial [Streptococcus suis]|uniref:SEC10/PgrA surface exclusion domain-containing protein n=1 Tax=Streptococcus suis TaxID=1307 RepID=UPI00129016B9
MALSQYYAYVMNGLRQQVWGVQNLVVQDDSIQAIKAIVAAYESENKAWSTGHSNTALNAGNTYAKWTSENLGQTSSTTTTMSALYKQIYDGAISTLRRDYSSKYGHVVNMLGSSSSTTQIAVG